MSAKLEPDRTISKIAYSTYSQTLVQGQQSLNVTSGESSAYKIGFYKFVAIASDIYNHR